MAPPRVLRFPRSDEDGFVLVHTSPVGSKSSPLDLKLLATDQETSYVYQLRHSRLSKLRAGCSESEWKDILSSIFLDLQPIGGIEAVCRVDKGHSITITIRKNLSGIVKRLGAVTLDWDEDELGSVSLFDWCGEAVQSRKALGKELADATDKASKLEDDVTSLKAQLDEFRLASKKDEKDMLAWACNLINEKKVAIRTSKKILTTATVDKKKLAAAKKGKQAAGRVSGASRKGKRKADEAAAATESEGDSDDGFEKMDVDQDGEPKEKDDDSEDAGRVTSDDETASEPDDEDEAASSPAKRFDKLPSAGLRGKASAATQDDLPVQRSLPINSSKGSAGIRSKVAMAAADPGSEIESDPDEL